MTSESNAGSRRYTHIIGWGTALPKKVLTNAEIANSGINTTETKIQELTGIEERHIATKPEESTVGLAVLAALHALEVADIPPEKIGLIITATSSPDNIFPSTASVVQDKIGATHAGAFDLSAACSGFVYGMNMADAYIKSGNTEYALVIGSETLSRFVDWTDRYTCILFGDGAGAVILAASDVPGGILATEIGSDGSGRDLLTLKAGGSQLPDRVDQVIKMDGRPVFKFGIRKLVESVKSVVAQAGLTMQDIDFVVPHQANARILATAAKDLGIPEDRMLTTIQKHGNTSAASIPLTLNDTIKEGRIRPGDTLVFVGFGGGLTWASCVVKWGAPTDIPTPSWWKQTQRSTKSRLAAIRSWTNKQRHRLGV